MKGNVVNVTPQVIIRYGYNNKIKTGCIDKNKAIPFFMAGTLLLSLLSLVYLEIDWVKILGRVPDIGTVFYRLAQFDFKFMDLIGEAPKTFSACAGWPYWCSRGLRFCAPCLPRYGCF